MSVNLDYLSPFRTTAFNYLTDSIVDIELQTFYDGSVNIITTCENTAPRIVNSRQKFTDANVDIIVRKADNLDNVYSNITIDKTLLIPTLSEVVPVLTFVNVFPESGRLVNGGYKYYFKLKTADGIESPLVEESRLVSIHTGTAYGKATSHIDGLITKNSVQFTLNGIDTKVYKYVSVYYVRASGEVQPTVKVAYHIDKNYEIVPTSEYLGNCQITHTGFEGETLINVADIMAEYSPITSATTVSQKNSRLLLGNVKTTSITSDVLTTAALKCYVLPDADSTFFTEQLVNRGVATEDDTYADPFNIYYKLGYFPGETYELAVNFVFRSGAVSASYPIMGMDYVQKGQTFINFNTTLLGTEISPWEASGQNSQGVVRMQYIPIEDTLTQGIVENMNLSSVDTHTMTIDTTKMITEDLSALRALGVVSYFISRKKRMPNLLMEGLLTLAGTAPASSMYPMEMTNYMFGESLGYGLAGPLADNLVLFPLPGSAMPFSSERLYAANSKLSTFFFDGILYAPLASAHNNTYFAFYSPDITSDTASSSVLNTKSTYSVEVSSFLTQNIAYKDKPLLRCVGDAITRYAYCANPYRWVTIAWNGSISRLKYVDDGIRSFSAMDFTGRLDRQSAIALYNGLISLMENGGTNWTGDTVDKCTVLYRQRQYEWYVYNGKLPYISNALLHTVAVFSSGGTCKVDYPTSANPPQHIPMTGVKYSPYLGLVLENSYDVSIGLSMDTSASAPVGLFTGYETTANMIPADNSTYMGHLARIYNQSEGMLTATAWKAKYGIERSDNYSAITRRFDISYPISYATRNDAYLSGGDCYSGIYYQRVWRPGGIDGIPTANNPSNYSSDGGTTPIFSREGVNITNSGYAIGFPVRSSFNFALRALQNVDDTEQALYGKGRTYTSSYPVEETHGNRQPETSVINYGNSIDESILQYSAFDPQIPYTALDYTNRIVVSNISVKGEFENGFRDFKGLNFKDYDEDLGTITTLISNGLYTYVVYTNGISLIEVSERAAVTANTGTNVYIASADVLPPKSTPIFTTIGSQHLRSVIPLDTGAFGVDANARKIWAVNATDKKVISEGVVQATLNKLITSTLKDIVSSYSVTFDEITFTFIYNDNSQKSLLYNTRHNLWYGTTDIHKIYQFNVDDRIMSLQKPNDSSIYSLYFPVVHTNSSAYFDSVGKATAIDDCQTPSKLSYDSYIEFVVKTEQFNKFNLSDIIINGNGIPSSIDVMAESLDAYTIDTAPYSISGLEQKVLPVHTNIYMKDAVQADIARIAGTDYYKFKRKRNVSYKTLAIGDRITLEIASKMYQFTIANLVYNATDSPTPTDTIILNHPMPSTGTLTTMYYGWKVPMRLSLGEVMGGKVKLTIPSKKHADRLKATSTTIQNERVNYSNARPYGRWVKLRLNFKGIEQIYIESIMSEITLNYS